LHSLRQYKQFETGRSLIIKRRFFIICGLVLAFVAALGVSLAWALESRWALDQLEERASTRLGRTVSIKDHDIDWGLAPRLTLTGISVDNAAWAHAPLLMETERLTLGISLPRLLSGRLHLPLVFIDEPRVNLQRNGEGAVNWQFKDDEKSDGELLIPSVDTVRLRDGRVSYRDPVLKLPVQARAQAELVEAQMNARVRGSAGGGDLNATLRLDMRSPGASGDLRATAGEIDLAELLAIPAPTGDDHSLQSGSGIALGEVEGSLDLRLPEGRSNGAPLTLDGVTERLRLDGLHLQYDDPGLDTPSNLRVVAADFQSALRVNGDIVYRDHTVSVDLSTGPLEQVFSAWRSLPIDLALSTDGTRVEVDTTAGGLYPVEELSAVISIKGPSPRQIGTLLELPLPDMPPYRVTTRLERSRTESGGDTWIFRDFEGRVGDSDISGDWRFASEGERLSLSAELRSESLDFDDLGPIVGVPPDPTETASSAQEKATEAYQERSRALPTRTLDLTRLGLIEADLAYQAKAIQAPALPLDDVAVELSLEDGVLSSRRIDFGVAGGTAAFDVQLEAGEKPWQGKLAGEFDRVGLGRILESTEAADDTLGKIGGSLTLWVQGDSVAEWLASADGGSYLTLKGGEIDSLLLELAGLDFVESLGVFLGEETSVAIDCSYVDLQARSGIVTVDPLLIDTSDTKIRGQGTINLREEQVDLTLRPYPKDFSLLSSRGPLHIDGTFLSPEFSVDASIPTPETGSAGDSARCEGLVKALRDGRKKTDRSKEAGAP